MKTLVEGQVVSCSNKIKVEDASIKTGTLYWINGTDYHVLDNEGYIHLCARHEVFEPQEGV